MLPPSTKKIQKDFISLAKTGDISKIMFYLSCHLDDLDINNTYNTAAEYGHLEAIKYLDSKFYIRPDNKSLALISAVNNKQLETVKYLISKGADVDYIDLTDNTPLRKAIYNQDLDMIKLLFKHNVNIEKLDILSNSPLSMVISTKNLSLVKYFVENGAKIFHYDNLDINHILSSAIYTGDIEIFKYLVNNGAEIESQIKDIIFNAAENNKLDIVRYYIIERGYDINFLLSNVNFIHEDVFNWAEKYNNSKEFNKKLQHDLSNENKQTKRVKV